VLCGALLPVLLTKYYSNDHIRIRWTGHVACMGERRGAYRVLLGKPDGRRPLGRPRYRWENKTKTDLQDVRLGDMDWADLSQDKDTRRDLADTVTNSQVLQRAEYFLTI